MRPSIVSGTRRSLAPHLGLELVERDRSIEERARAEEARREAERREFARWKQEQDRLKEAEDNAIPPPREKNPQVVTPVDPVSGNLALVDPGAGLLPTVHDREIGAVEGTGQDDEKCQHDQQFQQGEASVI